MGLSPLPHRKGSLLERGCDEGGRQQGLDGAGRRVHQEKLLLLSVSAPIKCSLTLTFYFFAYRTRLQKVIDAEGGVIEK